MANFDVLFYDSPNPMWVFDTCTLQILEVNRAAIMAYGYSKQEFLAKTITDLRPQEDASLVTSLLPQIRAKQTHFREFRHQDKNGRIFHVEIMSYPIIFEGAEARLVVTQNVEEKKAIAGALELTQTKLNRMLETTSIGFFQVDKNSVITYWNRAAEQLIGYERKYLLGKNIWDVFPEAVDTEFFFRYQQALERKFNAEFNAYFWPVQKWFAIIIYPTDDGLVIHFRDITETKMYEEKLLEKIDQLKEVSYLNSHYIRKPVASLLGLTGLIKQNLVEGEEYRDIAGHIHECSKELDQAVRRINDKVNYELGYGVYDEVQNFSLNQLVEEVIKDAGRYQQTHRIILKNNEEVNCYGNKHSIAAALKELLDNAVKYSPGADRVEICLDLVNSNGILSVQDFGAGIDKQTLNRIFMSFSKKSVADELGTGLSKVAEVARKHNGNIWVESKPGKGATFCMRIPMSNIGAYKQGGSPDFSAYKGPGLELGYDNALECVVAEWQGFHSLHSVKTGCLKILRFIGKNKPAYILNDNTKIAGTWNDAVDWVAKEYFPMLQEAGITHVAWVYSTSTFSRLSTDMTIASLQTDIIVRTFETAEEAVSWLQEVNVAK